MAKVDCKATILELHIVKLYRCNQQRQKLPRSNWEKLVLSIMFASSCAAWFAAGNGTAIAANPDIYESKGMVSAILSPVEPPNKTRSPITSEIAQVVSQGEDFELLKTAPHHTGAWLADLGQPIATLITKERLTEALTLSSDRHYGKHERVKETSHAVNIAAVRFLRHDVDLLLPAKVMPPRTPANIEVVPPCKRNFKPTENLKNAELPKGESQLKVQLIFPHPDPEHQPTLTGENLDAPRSDGNSELGTLRLRKLEFPPPETDTDAELGTLRLRELEAPRQAQADAELGTLRVRELEAEPLATDSDLELGNLRIQEQELQPPQKVQSPRYQTTARLIAQAGYFQTNNIFFGIDPVDDSLLSLGLTLVAAPALGPKTALVTAIDGDLIRYIDQSESNYNQLRFRAGIRQQLTPQMYGEIGWNNQQLFRARIGDRFLNENSIRLAFQRRDQLTDKLRLNTLYEFRLSDADPESRSRIINSLLVSLSYSLKRDLQVGLDYQFALSNFTQRDRQDQYHRLLGRLTYALSRDSQISIQSGLTFGGSSQPNIDFDNLFFSVTYIIELGKF